MEALTKFLNYTSRFNPKVDYNKLLEILLVIPNDTEIPDEEIDRIIKIFSQKSRSELEYKADEIQNILAHITDRQNLKQKYVTSLLEIYLIKIDDFARLGRKRDFTWLDNLQKKHHYILSKKQKELLTKLGQIKEYNINSLISFINNNKENFDLKIFEDTLVNCHLSKENNFLILKQVFANFATKIKTCSHDINANKIIEILKIFKKNSLFIKGNTIELLNNYIIQLSNFILIKNQKKDDSVESGKTAIEKSFFNEYFENLKNITETNIEYTYEEIKSLYNFDAEYSCSYDFLINIVKYINKDSFTPQTLAYLLLLKSNGRGFNYECDAGKISFIEVQWIIYEKFIMNLKHKRDGEYFMNEIFNTIDELRKSRIHDKNYSPKIFLDLFKYLLDTESEFLCLNKRFLDFVASWYHYDDETSSNFIQKCIENKVLPDNNTLRSFRRGTISNEIITMFTNTGLIIDEEVLKIFLDKNYIYPNMKHLGLKLTDEHYDIMHFNSEYPEEYIELFENKYQIMLRIKFDNEDLYKICSINAMNLQLKVIDFKEKHNLFFDKYCYENKLKHSGLMGLYFDNKLVDFEYPTEIKMKSILRINSVYTRAQVYKYFNDLDKIKN